jgi:tetratricopeptide (TPR) repeat protein
MRRRPILLAAFSCCWLAASVLTAQYNGVRLEELYDAPSNRADAIEVTPARTAMYDGMVDAQDGLFEEAIVKLEFAIEQDPTLIAAWETLGWSYWQVDRREDAAELWQRLVVIAPHEPMGYNLLAQVATRDGDFAKAESLYLNSLQLNPDQYEVRLNLARVYLWGGKQNDAVRLLSRLFDEDPDRLDVEIELAWALYISEEYEEALQHWNHINEEIPDNPTFLMARSNVLILLGALDEAEADARHVLELEPRNPDALNLLAALAVRMHRPEEAVEALERVLEEADDDDIKAQIAMRIAIYMKSVLDSDSTLFTRADILGWVDTSLEYDDGEMGTHLYKGEMLIADKQFAAAERSFNHVLEEFNPFAQRAHFGVLETYFGRRMYEEAEQQIRTIFNQFNPNNPFRHMFMARLHFARGRFYDALDSLERLEHEGAQGAVFSLLYHGISPSEFSDMPSARQLREHLMALRRDGFRFITPAQLQTYF